MILTSIFVCFCVASAINYLKTRRQRKTIKNLKGPFTWPLLGSMHKLLLLTPKNFFHRSSTYLAKYGKFSRCWVFHRLFIPVADRELAQQLLHNEQYLETGNELMQDWLNGGILMCNKDQWPQRHQMLSKLFEQQNLMQLVDLCRYRAVQFELKFTEKANQEVFNVWEVVSPLVMDLMVMITCGVRPTEDYTVALNSLCELYRQRFLSAQSANRFTFWLTCPLMRRRQKRLIKHLNANHKQFINQNRRQWQMQEQTKGNCFIIDAKYHQSLLDILLLQGDLSENEICGELNTCNYFGYLLCSTTICFALVMIARHPSVQMRCLEEIKKARDSAGWDLQRLPFLESVIMETLRLYPPQVIVGRELSTDFPYTHSVVGNGNLPAGAEIYINLFEMQRNGEHQLNAQHFQPERFLENPPELLSFGIGQRACPARQFTVSLLKSLLAPILEKFEFLPYGDALKLDLQLILGSRNGFQLALKER
ncbi:uncharacterized protein Dwil_GK17388 [Drosophila willistoni]|uniref:Uncharacterized protein n=1 Tax=Drosophila willistoni TaxID=7260 RepID=B4MLT4_DROWI|nr:probable cytochrome P450 316a1 [Drosophila willistoni]EDW73145.1 uncharacterized protein Dwil_GK17388 [Drosophila willistoni]